MCRRERGIASLPRRFGQRELRMTWTSRSRILRAVASPMRGEPAVSNLAAVARNGQVFVTWDEGDAPAGSTFNAYVSGRAITDVSRARRVGHHIERHSGA